MKIVFLIGIIIAMVGVILIYDARPITKKMFSFGDQNEATMGLKILGFVISIIGMILILGRSKMIKKLHWGQTKQNYKQNIDFI